MDPSQISSKPSLLHSPSMRCSLPLKSWACPSFSSTVLPLSDLCPLMANSITNKKKFAQIRQMPCPPSTSALYRRNSWREDILKLRSRFVFIYFPAFWMKDGRLSFSILKPPLVILCAIHLSSKENWEHNQSHISYLWVVSFACNNLRLLLSGWSFKQWEFVLTFTKINICHNVRHLLRGYTKPCLLILLEHFLLAPQVQMS